jgi:pilus assembly protein Flp/PilA
VQSIITTLKSIRDDRRAVTALEYGLIAGVLVLTIVVGFGALGSGMENTFNNIAADLT